MKINNFRGDLTDISAKKEALTGGHAQDAGTTPIAPPPSVPEAASASVPAGMAQMIAVTIAVAALFGTFV